MKNVFCFIIMLQLFLSSCSKIETRENPSKSEVAALQNNFPTVQDGILKFSDNDQLDEYDDYLDQIQQNFNYNDYPEYCGNKALDIEEANRGYVSMRKILNDLGCMDGEAYANHEFIRMPEHTSRLFNEYGEIWIGSNIFKYFDHFNYIQIENNDLATLLDIRQNGLKMQSNIKWHNSATDDIIASSPNGACKLGLFLYDYNPNYQANNLYLKLAIVLYDMAGKEVKTVYALNVSINWGDGQIQNFTINNSPNELVTISHNYSMSFNGPNSDIFVSAAGTITTCNCSCANSTVSGNMTFHNWLNPCQFSKEACSREISTTNYIYNGLPYKLVLSQYFNLNGDFWDGYKAIAELTGKHFTNNKLSNPGVSMTVGAMGGTVNMEGTSIYRDACNNFDRAFNPKTLKLSGITVTNKRGRHTRWDKNYIDNIRCRINVSEAPSHTFQTNEFEYWR